MPSSWGTVRPVSCSILVVVNESISCFRGDGPVKLKSFAAALKACHDLHQQVPKHFSCWRSTGKFSLAYAVWPLSKVIQTNLWRTTVWINHTIPKHHQQNTSAFVVYIQCIWWMKDTVSFHWFAAAGHVGSVRVWIPQDISSLPFGKLCRCILAMVCPILERSMPWGARSPCLMDGAF